MITRPPRLTPLRSFAAPGAVALLGLLACARTPAGADGRFAALSADTALKSAAHFTQDFYDWYRRHEDRMEVAVRERGGAFEPALLAALQADFAAQAKDTEEIVGLDWDPFTWSQDPCDAYVAMDATWHGDTVNVPVKSTCIRTPAQTGPDVIVQLRRSGTTWVFMDFRPDSGAGLREDLAMLAKDRDSPPPRKRR